MMDFIFLISRLYSSIFGVLGSVVIPFGTNFQETTTLGGILFVCIVIGFAVSIFWKGAQTK